MYQSFRTNSCIHCLAAISFIFASVSLAPRSGCAEEEVPLKVPVIAPLRPDQIAAITDAIDNDKMLVIPPTLKHELVRPDVSGVWAGSMTKVNTEVTDIVFRFGRREGAQPSPIETFDLNVNVGEIIMTMRHSAPKNHKDYLGLKIRVDPKVANRTRAPFIEGLGDSGFNFVIPPLADPLKEWAFLVCPRHVVKTTTKKDRGLVETKYELRESPYVLKQIGFQMTGRGEAELQTVGQKGFAGIRLATTSQVPSSGEYEDRAVSTVPHPMVEYRKTREFDLMNVGPDGSFAEGLGFSVTMQNQARLVRRQYYINAVYASYIDYTRERIIVGNKMFGPDTGKCILLAWRKEQASMYSKEPPIYGPDAQAPAISDGTAVETPAQK